MITEIQYSKPKVGMSRDSLCYSNSWAATSVALHNFVCWIATKWMGLKWVIDASDAYTDSGLWNYRSYMNSEHFSNVWRAFGAIDASITYQVNCLVAKHSAVSLIFAISNDFKYSQFPTETRREPQWVVERLVPVVLVAWILYLFLDLK